MQVQMRKDKEEEDRLVDMYAPVGSPLENIRKQINASQPPITRSHFNPRDNLKNIESTDSLLNNKIH